MDLRRFCTGRRMSGLPLGSGFGLDFHDCLTGEDLGTQRESFAQKVEPHGCRVYRCRLTK